jgi:hypothetical protein
MVVGGEHTVKFPSELRQEGNHEFAVLPPPLHVSFEIDASGTTADLLNHSMVQGMTGIDDIWRNSGEILRDGEDSREG